MRVLLIFWKSLKDKILNSKEVFENETLTTLEFTKKVNLEEKEFMNTLIRSSNKNMQ